MDMVLISMLMIKMSATMSDRMVVMRRMLKEILSLSSSPNLTRVIEYELGR
jgi:hypothetical protein